MSLYILPDVVMSVCRRCVGDFVIKMGGKEGIRVEFVDQNKANMLIEIDLPEPVSYRLIVFTVKVFIRNMLNMCYYT